MKRISLSEDSTHLKVSFVVERNLRHGTGIAVLAHQLDLFIGGFGCCLQLLHGNLQITFDFTAFGDDGHGLNQWQTVQKISEVDKRPADRSSIRFEGGFFQAFVSYRPIGRNQGKRS